MSEVMLHGILNMPPELWRDTEIDKMQRYSAYKEASEKIEDLEENLRLLSNEMVYRGNSVQYWHEKAVAYGNAVLVQRECIQELEEAIRDHKTNSVVSRKAIVTDWKLWSVLNKTEDKE